MEMYWEGPKYRDRQDAGLVLAAKLEPYRLKRPIILAIPNGGVAVALPIARHFDCPLHLIVVRKLQIPGNPEAGFGSVASDGSLLLNEPLIRRLGLTKEVIARKKDQALKTIRARLGKYGPAAVFPDLRDRDVILVDDGLASGLTMEAAVQGVKKHKPERVFVAVPTSSMSAFRRISPRVDTVVCPDVSRLPIFAVADAYEIWRDLDDQEVMHMIQSAS